MLATQKFKNLRDSNDLFLAIMAIRKKIHTEMTIKPSPTVLRIVSLVAEYIFAIWD